MKRLEIIYKDGSSCDVGNRTKNTTNAMFKAHIDSINPKRVKTAILYVRSSPLVLIKDGIVINRLEDIKEI